MAVDYDDDSTYGAQLRSKGVIVDAGAAKSTRRGKPSSNAEYNGWERGVEGEHRPDGSFMPYLNGEGSPIRKKAMSEGRHDKALESLKQLRNSADT